MIGGVGFLLNIFRCKPPKATNSEEEEEDEEEKRMVKVGTYMHLCFPNALFVNAPTRFGNNGDAKGEFALTKCAPGEMGNAHNP